MVFKMYQSFFAVLLSAVVLGIVGCDEISDRISSMSLPGCDGQREVAGWEVTSGLEKTSASDFLISKWEASRDYSTFFGIRITYDTSQSPTPQLKIWQDYKSGNFTMRFPDGSQLTTSLNANYASTTVSLREIDVITLGSEPIRIEHTSHTGKWEVYQTDGLPTAIAAGKADLELAKEKLSNKECAI